MSSGRSCKNDNARFRTVPVKPYSNKMWKIPLFKWLDTFLVLVISPLPRNAQVTFETKRFRSSLWIGHCHLCWEGYMKFNLQFCFKLIKSQFYFFNCLIVLILMSSLNLKGRPQTSFRVLFAALQIAA